MPARFDAVWLWERDRDLFDCFGQRMDVAGLARWSNPAIPRLRDGNHAAVGPGEGLIPDQLVRLFDAQRADGARRKCIDVYGPRGDIDRLCVELGLALETEAELLLVIYDRDGIRPPRPADDAAERVAPPVVRIDPGDWVETVTTARKERVDPWERDVLMTEALVDSATFYSIRIGDGSVACVARYDMKGHSRIASVFTDPDFRNTGFGRACLSRAAFESPNPIVFGTIASDNAGMLAVSARVGCEIEARDVRRRYVGKW